MCELDDVVSEFLVETRESLDQFDRDVIGLESSSSPRDALASIFRVIHSIKGASGFLAFGRLEGIAHAAEGLLSRMRDGSLLPNAVIASALLEMADCIRSVMANIEATGQEGDVDWQPLIRRIESLQEPAVSSNNAVANAAAEDVFVYGTSGDLSQSDGAKPIGQLLIERAGVDPAAVAAARELQRSGDLRTLGEILVSQGRVSPRLARSVVEYQQEARTATTVDARVRVDVARLDKMMNLVDALGRVRDDIVQLSQRLNSPEFSTAAQRLDRIAVQLRRESKQACMQPIGALWGRLPRLVRDLALANGKRVVLNLEGREIELDRLILEAIKDPLLHLVRNAIDHGIEAPLQRRSGGKRPDGCLTVRARHRGDEVRIEVADDGAGIDPERVKGKALAQGFLGEKEASRLSERQIVNLIFLPGLTTAKRVTNISGRGVGMDVVKTNVEGIGGSVEVKTDLGKGTKVTLRIPARSEFD